jgi:1,4-dihydroxy-2-naphthoyl-CoA hydrolase
MLSISDINRQCENTLVSHLGIKITAITDHSIAGMMPVNSCVMQPAGMLHGGASVTLAETLASIGANQCLKSENKYCVGMEINANHIKGISYGTVHAEAKIIHKGNKTQVWSVEIRDDDGDLVCICRMTAVVVSRKKMS